MNPDPRLAKEIFLQALEKHDPGQWPAFLDQACAGEPELRSRVEVLLEAHRKAGTAAQADVESSLSHDANAAGELPGAIIGPYKLIEQIGEGGMGTVWMAQQIEPVKRVVAVKLIKAGMDSKQVIARFEAERQALALMDHANIARVLDAGATSTGRPYFVMDLVKGMPITKYCDEHHLTPRQRLELFIPVCQAVQHAHQKGIIHRDLKPSNVLVALYDGKPVPKVIDFGVAKAAGQQLTDKTLVTGFGNIVGTLEYMSPEQAEINQLDIDTRSDIYSLGVLLYELLVGSTPFTRKDLEKAGMLEMLRIIREQEPSKPSTKLSTADGLPTLAANRGTAPAKLTRLMRGELDWIVMKALEKDRKRRYETANGFAMDVQRYLADEPVQACPPSFSYRMQKFARRNKRILGTAVLLGVMMIVAAGAVVENFRREAKAQEDAHDRLLQKQKDEARKREELARRLATTESAVSLSLARSDSFAQQAAHLPTATSREASAALAMWQQADAELAQAEAALVTGAAESPVHERVASARRRLDLARNLTEQQHARALREEKLRHDLDEANMARPTMAGDHAGAAAASEQFDKAFKAYGLELKPDQTGALAKRIRAEKPELRDVLIAGIDNWGWVAAGNRIMTPIVLRTIASAADDDPWRAAYRDAISKRDAATLKSLATKARDLTLPAASLYLLAESLFKLDQKAEAVSLLRWARDKHPRDMWIPYHLAILLESDPQRPAAVFEEQIGCYRLFLALRPDSPVVLNNLGACLARRGKVDESITAFRAAVKLKPDYAMAHGNLGNSLGQKGRLDEALAAHDEAIRLAPDNASFLSNRGMVLLNKGLVDQAVAALEKAVQLNPKLALVQSNLGHALHKKSLFKQAIAACEEAIRLDPNLAQAYTNLGVVLADQQKLDDAIVAFEHAVRLDPNDPTPYWNFAAVLNEKKQPVEAEKKSRKALELQPNLAPAHEALGIALTLQEKNTEAIASFREALRHKPDFAEVHFNLGMVFIKQKQASEAMTALELAIKHDPRYAAAHYQIGRIHAENKQHAEAIKFFKKAHALKETWAEARFQVGVSQRELNDIDAAFETFKEVTRQDPNHAWCHYNLGLIHEHQKRPEAAIASYKEAIRLEPNRAPFHYNLGTLLADKKQLAEAADAFRLAIKSDKNYAKGHYNLGIVLAMQGKVADATPCFREALRCQPDYALARQSLARALNEQAWSLVAPKETSRADAERAVKMANEAVELTPKDADPWNTLGVGYYRAGKWDEAIPALKKSASISKQDDWCDFLFLAMAHWKKGDKAEARTWYDRGVARIREQKIKTEDSRRFQAEAAALLGLAKESK